MSTMFFSISIIIRYLIVTSGVNVPVYYVILPADSNTNSIIQTPHQFINIAIYILICEHETSIFIFSITFFKFNKFRHIILKCCGQIELILRLLVYIIKYLNIKQAPEKYNFQEFFYRLVSNTVAGQIEFFFREIINSQMGNNNHTVLCSYTIIYKVCYIFVRLHYLLGMDIFIHYHLHDHDISPLEISSDEFKQAFSQTFP